MTANDPWSQLLPGPFLPVLDLVDPGLAVEVTEVLVESGITTVEFSVKRAGALAALTAAGGVAGATIGAGTVRGRDGLSAAVDAGAQFVVSPGIDWAIIEADPSVPYLPGIATATELTAATTAGYTTVKFFPAEAAGGVRALDQLAGVFTEVRFVPIGGITWDNLGDYLARPSVRCCGGTLLTPSESLAPSRLPVVEANVASLHERHGRRRTVTT